MGRTKGVLEGFTHASLLGFFLVSGQYFISIPPENVMLLGFQRV